MNTDKIYAEHIANEYSKKDTTKVVQLKKLDAKAKAPANIFAYTFGICSTLLFGVGMCLGMQVIATGVGAIISGVVVGIAGITGCATNYPIYKKLREKGKNKYGSDIVRLANEISQQEDA